MAHYVDGYLLPVPKKSIAFYAHMAKKASKIWKEHGALDYKECVGDDLNVKMGTPFPRGIKPSRAKRWRSPTLFTSRARIVIA